MSAVQYGGNGVVGELCITYGKKQDSAETSGFELLGRWQMHLGDICLPDVLSYNVLNYCVTLVNGELNSWV